MSQDRPVGIPTTMMFTEEDLKDVGKTIALDSHSKVARISLKKDESGKLTIQLLGS